ncbi:MAG: hypothetical protein MJ078_06440, partial [Clostridia bacterium]|nr:hypothetical protein [Clostridia bacterium]
MNTLCRNANAPAPRKRFATIPCGQIGALKLLDGEKFLTTGRFSRECIFTGLQEFFMTAGGTTKIPTYTEFSIRDKAIRKMYNCMLESAKVNLDLCMKQLQSISGDVEIMHLLLRAGAEIHNGISPYEMALLGDG